jgi:multidrug resistance efflux pump
MTVATRKGRGVKVGVGVVLVLTLVGGAAALKGVRPNGAEASPPPRESEEYAIEVNTLRPRGDKHFTVTAEAPAYVTPYYQADLEARVPGPVDKIEVDIGDEVKKKQPLVTIAVPDLQAALKQKHNLIAQRRQEKVLAEKQAEIATEAVATARTDIRLNVSKLSEATATLAYRELKYHRFMELAQKGSVIQDVVDEYLKELEVARAAQTSATVAVEKAKSALKEAEAKLEAARADVTHQDTLIEVARSDRERAQALLSYATIEAPFKGKITQRNVDPGSWVQNAATAQAKPLLSLERTDIVTVYTKLPDTYARYVSADTEAVLCIRELPGMEFHGKVTRFSGSLRTPEHDRTMRVEVDLFNGSPEDWQRFLAEEKAAPKPYGDLKNTLRGAQTRRPEDKLPNFPEVKAKAGSVEWGQFLPGMYGKMRLVLRRFRNVQWLVPSYAVVNEGGESYLYLVKDGVAHKVQVRVSVDNGQLARVLVLGENGALNKLTGDEEIISSNQGELCEGQAVKVQRLGTRW